MEKIDVDTLRQWLDDPEVFIMDVRNPGDWDASSSKIEHAQRFETAKVGRVGQRPAPG